MHVPVTQASKQGSASKYRYLLARNAHWIERGTHPEPRTTIAHDHSLALRGDGGRLPMSNRSPGALERRPVGRLF